MANVAESRGSSSLAEVIDRIPDSGIVIDAWARVSLVGMELLSVEALAVIASIETSLKRAEPIGLTAAPAAPAKLPLAGPGSWWGYDHRTLHHRQALPSG